MIGLDDVSEADEGATDVPTALENLRFQIRQGESMAVVDMYERAAWGAGATVAETEAAIFYGRQQRKASEQ